MAEKVRAIMTRNKARDVYDLWFLMTGPDAEGGSTLWGKDTISLIDRKLEYYNMKFDSEDFKENLREKEDFWKAELDPIIFGQLPAFEEVRNLIASSVPM